MMSWLFLHRSEWRCRCRCVCVCVCVRCTVLMLRIHYDNTWARKWGIFPDTEMFRYRYQVKGCPLQWVGGAAAGAALAGAASQTLPAKRCRGAQHGEGCPHVSFDDVPDAAVRLSTSRMQASK